MAKANVIGTREEFERSDVHILRMPNNTFKAAITFENNFIVFLARPFNKELREKYNMDGCIVKAYVTKDTDIFDAKWADKPTKEFHYASNENKDEVSAILSSIIIYTGYNTQLYKIMDYNPLYVCDEITFNMKKVLTFNMKKVLKMYE